MPNYKDFLIGSIPTSAWMLDSTTSLEPDLAMTSRSATISVADKSGNPIVSGAERAYTLQSYDYIYYPNMNIWSAGNHGNAFSVEFVIKPLDQSAAATIFSPMSGSVAVTNNAIYVDSGKIAFKVGNSQVSYQAYTFLDFVGDISHIVATYEKNSISLWLNGVKEHVVSIPEGFYWEHNLDTNAYKTFGSTGKVTLSALAVYKGVIPETEITKHYRSLMLRDNPVAVSTPLGGTTFMINDDDRQKGYYFSSPMIDSWDTATIDNLEVVNDRLTLETIVAPTLNTGTPTFSSSKLALSSSQYLLISDADTHIGPLTGAVGTYVKYAAARHGVLASGEYCILSIFNADKTNVIELLEKSDKKIYLRYKSNDVVTDSLLASPSTGIDSNNYAYVKFSSTAITAYWNDYATTTSISIDSEANILSPKFASGSSVILGASRDGLDFWGSNFWWTNLWKTPRIDSEIASFKDETYQYTLKLGSSLSVSQVGSALFVLDTGYDGDAPDAELVNQSRIWWAPTVPNTQILVESSVGEFSVAENMFPISGASAGAAIPTTVFIRVTLSTDDSVDNVVFLKKLGVDILTSSDVIAEGSQDSIVFASDPKIDFNVESVATQSLYHGARIDSPATACKIYSYQGNSPVSDNTDIPETSDTMAPPTKLSTGKTLEFWARPLSTSSGLMFKYSGTDTHYLSYNGATRIFEVLGFNKLYIDGFQVPLTLSSGTWKTTARDSYFNDKWHHFVLVKKDVISHVDETLFTAASGSPTLSIDQSKFYYGEKSFKLVSGGSTGWVTVYNSLVDINILSGEKNTLSFLVYPNTGVTSVQTNYRYNGIDSTQSHPGLTPETWNLVTRTVTNAANLTTLDVRIGTSSTSQTIWLDGVALVTGADAFIKFLNTDSNSSWFGYDVSSPGSQQAIFDLQNPTFYNQTLSSLDIMNNYYRYVGDSGRALASPASKNYLTNGNFDDGTTGYGTTVFGWTTATIDQSSTRSVFGSYSCRVTLPTTAAGATGVRTNLVTGLVTGNRYTASVYIYVPAATTSGFRLADVYGTASSNWQYVGTTFTSNIKDRWVRLFGTFTYTGGNLYLGVTGSDGVATTAGQTIWVDGFMLEDGERVTEFANGGNLLPSLENEYVVSEPTAVLNRNLEDGHPDLVVFTTNPVYLSYAWQILGAS